MKVATKSMTGKWPIGRATGGTFAWPPMFGGDALVSAGGFVVPAGGAGDGDGAAWANAPAVPPRKSITATHAVTAVRINTI
ncbi:MAG: hypothetical protein NVS2B17_21980 [Candidatus Velthaea sp.]